MVAPRLARLRPADVMAGGLTVAALGFLLITQAGRVDGPGLVVAGMVLQSIGIAPVFTLTNDLIMSAAPPERAGAASAFRKPPPGSAARSASRSSAAWRPRSTVRRSTLRRWRGRWSWARPSQRFWCWGWRRPSSACCAQRRRRHSIRGCSRSSRSRISPRPTPRGCRR